MPAKAAERLPPDALPKGGQVDLGLSLESSSVSDDDDEHQHTGHPPLFVLKASDEELDQHELRLEDIEKQSGHCLYKQA